MCQATNTEAAHGPHGHLSGGTNLPRPLDKPEDCHLQARMSLQPPLPAHPAHTPVLLLCLCACWEPCRRGGDS